MAKRINEVMNRELFAARPDESASDVMGYLLSLGITGAPVVDATWRPIGFVSLRDLVGAERTASVQTRMSAPAVYIDDTALIRDAAQRMVEADLHHMVCVDEDGHVCGFVGALDVLRGMLGIPPRHPAGFPNYDAKIGLRWSESRRFGAEEIASVQAAPGFYGLHTSTPDQPDQTLWIGSSNDVRSELLDILRSPQDAPPRVREHLTSGHLWFKVALAASPKALAQAIEEYRRLP